MNRYKHRMKYCIEELLGYLILSLIHCPVASSLLFVVFVNAAGLKHIHINI